MSLAYFAAPIDNNSNISNNNDNNDNIINQKRHKITQKKYPKMENFDSYKVNSVLQKIHNNPDDTDEDNDAFNPPPNPESSGVQKTIPPQKKEEPFSGMGFSSLDKTVGKAPMPNYENTDNLDLNNYSNYGDNKSNDEYYKRVIPGYNSNKNYTNKSYYQNYNRDTQQSSSEYVTQDVLLQKLNYMIHLLEEQQDEKTNYVTEEVILYSFLGIFIIFIADTFVRAGKYTR